MSELLLIPIVLFTSCLAAVMGMGGGILLGFYQTGLGMVAGATGPVGAAPDGIARADTFLSAGW